MSCKGVDDSPPVEIEEINGEAVATGDGVDLLLRYDPASAVEAER